MTWALVELALWCALAVTVGAVVVLAFRAWLTVRADNQRRLRYLRGPRVDWELARRLEQKTREKLRRN